MESSRIVAFSRLADDLKEMRLLVAGLSLVLLCKSSLRFSNMAGIYPLDLTLTARHALAALVLFAAAFAIARTRCAISARALRNIGVALSILLSACFGLTFWVEADALAVSLAAEVSKEAIIVLLMVVWMAAIVPHGIRQTLTAWGATAVCQGILQLTTCWLQYEANLVFIALAPIISAALLAASARRAFDLVPLDDHRCLALSNPDPKGRRRTPSLLLVILFGLLIVLGQMIRLALDHQANMSTSVFAGTFMGIGNCVGGLLVALYAKEIANAKPFSVALAIAAVVTVVTFYLAPFFDGVAAGLFLAVSSAVMQVTGAIPVAFAFLPEFDGQHPRARLSRYAFATGVNFCGCFAHTSVMVLSLDSSPDLYSVLNAAILVIVLLCCFSLARHAFLDSSATSSAAGAVAYMGASVSGEDEQAAEEESLEKSDAPAASKAPGASASPAPAASSASPEAAPHQKDEQPRPFAKAIDDLARESGLTPQEGNVLSQLARGLNARSISESMTLSSNTVRTHMRNVYAKLDVHSQQELIELVDRRVDAIRESARFTQSV